MPNGSREINRRLRQVAAGMLKTENGLRPTPVVVVAPEPEVIFDLAAPKKAPRKSRAKKVLVEA